MADANENLVRVGHALRRLGFADDVFVGATVTRLQ